MSYGTVGWFGTSWGAPICDPEQQWVVPVGDACAACGEPILATDRGLMILSLGAKRAEYKPWHLQCFARNVGPVCADAH